MIRPDFLRKNDTIGIVSPSGPIKENALDEAISILKSWGLQVKIGKNAYNHYGVFAGTDEERAEDFQAMLDDDSVKAIICARGGYGAIRMIDKLDFSTFMQNPKWIVGFSDITVFHAKIHSLEIESIHGAMAKSFPNVTAESLEYLHQCLFGRKKLTYKVAPSRANKTGKCVGQLIGGNLSMLYSMRGIDFEYDYNDKILFIEDLNEYLYHIDRMIQNLKFSNIFSQISGLIVGTMSGMKNGVDEYNGTIESIIREATAEYDFPILFGFPSGHEEENNAMILGATYSLSVTKNGGTLTIATKA